MKYNLLSVSVPLELRAIRELIRKAQEQRTYKPLDSRYQLMTTSLAHLEMAIDEAIKCFNEIGLPTPELDKNTDLRVHREARIYTLAAIIRDEIADLNRKDLENVTLSKLIEVTRGSVLEANGVKIDMQKGEVYVNGQKVG